MYVTCIFQAMAGSIPPLVSSSPPPLCGYDDDDEEDEDVYGVYAVAEELDYNGKIYYLFTLGAITHKRSKRDTANSLPGSIVPCRTLCESQCGGLLYIVSEHFYLIFHQKLTNYT